MPNINAAANGKNFFMNGKTLMPKAGVAADDADFGLYAVFGGHGEAAQIAANVLKKYNAELKKYGVTFGKFIHFYANEVRAEVEKGGGRAKDADFALLDVQSDAAFAYSVGESRVYLLRDGRLTQLTQNYGQEPYIAPPVEVLKGDMFLLCGGGLANVLSEVEIAKHMAVYEQPKAVAEAIIAEAAANIGGDKETVVVIRAAADLSSQTLLRAGFDNSNRSKHIKRAAGMSFVLVALLVFGHFAFDMFGLRNDDPRVAQNGAGTNAAAPDPTAEPTNPTPGPDFDPTPEPYVEATPNPYAEATPNPYVENTPNPYAETTPAPAVDPTPEPVAEPTPEPIPGHAAGELWRVVGTTVSFREGPSTNYPAFNWLYPGDTVTFINRVPNSNWLHVERNGVRGYIHGNYLAAGTPAATPTPPAAPPTPPPPTPPEYEYEPPEYEYEPEYAYEQQYEYEHEHEREHEQEYEYEHEYEYERE